MLERDIYQPVKESFSTIDLQRAIGLAWKETTTSNLEKLNNPHLRAVLTLCPLYEPGELGNSKLLHPDGASLDVSRVANKWSATQRVLRSVKKYSSTVDGDISLTAVFANKGILLNGDITEKDINAVEVHNEIYKEVLGEFCQSEGIDLTYHTYDDLNVSFPRFVDPSEKAPEVEEEGVIFRKNENKLITQLNFLTEELSIPVKVTDNKKNRDIVTKLLKINGMSRDNVYWLIAGYLAFDYKLPELVGENGFYIATERFEPLFGITSMTPGVKEMPKVKLKA